MAVASLAAIITGWWLLSGAVFLGVVSTPPFAGGLEARAIELIASGNLDCADSMATDEGGATINNNHDFIDSGDTWECWGNRSGVSSGIFTSTSGWAMEPVFWGDVRYSLEARNDLSSMSTILDTGPLAIVSGDAVLGWRFYIQVDADKTNAGNTSKPESGRCGYVVDSPAANDTCDWIYESATQLRCVGKDVTGLGNHWSGSPSTRVVKVVGPSTGTIYGNITDVSLSASDSIMTITWDSSSLVDEAYSFIGRGCVSCPRNKMVFANWGIYGNFALEERVDSSSCPAEGSFANTSLGLGGGPEAGVHGFSPGANYGDCKAAPCRLEFYIDGSLADGNTITFRSYLVSAGPDGVWGNGDDKEGILPAITPFDAGGGPFHTLGPTLTNARGDVYSIAGYYNIGMFIQARWQTDTDQRIGCAVEIEGSGC